MTSSNNFINKIIKKFKKSKDIEISNLFSDEEIENIIQKSKKEMEENYDKKMD